MKKIAAFSLLVLIIVNVRAQAPEKLSYQAIIRNNTGQLVVSQTIGMQISILQGSETGTVFYVETQTPTADANGLVSIAVGTGTVVSGTFESIDWSDNPYYIKTEIDPSGGTAYSITGTSQLLSVPYALFAGSAENIINSYDETQSLADVVALGNSANGQIKNVANPTDGFDAVTKAYVDSLISNVGLLPRNFAGMVTDVEGNRYKTIMVGTQTWMAENLRSTKFSDGSDIPLVTVNADWATTTTSAYCWYGNQASNSELAVICGALYNWHTVNTDMLCPTDWHVPTTDDLEVLVNYLGNIDVGGKLKENGTKIWRIPNAGANNESGFTALPTGYRKLDGVFDSIGESFRFWSGTEESADYAECALMWYDSAYIYGSQPFKVTGASVRCVKD